jgi:hypothetical protein
MPNCGIYAICEPWQKTKSEGVRGIVMLTL